MKPPLWAPWRMEYILGDKSGGCIFCGMAGAGGADLREKLVLVLQRQAFVCLNRFPFSAAHLLVAPRRHVADLSDLEPSEYAALMDLARESAGRLRAGVQPDGINLGFNLGHAAGAGIADHVHGHLVPRWQGDTNYMPVLADVRIMPEYLDDTWRRLYPHFADLPGERAPGPMTPP